MGIPESQLEIWAKPGPTNASSITYTSLKTALNADSSSIRGKDIDIYLQGSYANDTFIRADSDVDVVVQYNGSFDSYNPLVFRNDVLASLQSYLFYGPTLVHDGNKSIKILGANGRQNADVICGVKYLNGRSEGIQFYARGMSRYISNFPKLHIANGTTKNADTNGQYKPTIRMFKNARRYLTDNYNFDKSSVPSYFIECLLYNVPEIQYTGTYEDIFVNIWNYLNNNKANFSSFVAQNKQTRLFGEYATQWNEASARRFLDALKTLWTEWK